MKTFLHLRWGRGYREALTKAAVRKVHNSNEEKARINLKIIIIKGTILSVRCNRTIFLSVATLEFPGVDF